MTKLTPQASSATVGGLPGSECCRQRDRSVLAVPSGCVLNVALLSAASAIRASHSVTPSSSLLHVQAGPPSTTASSLSDALRPDTLLVDEQKSKLQVRLNLRPEDCGITQIIRMLAPEHAHVRVVCVSTVDEQVARHVQQQLSGNDCATDSKPAKATTVADANLPLHTPRFVVRLKAAPLSVLH
eukprot:1682550-Prymnesium_polylepis.1